MRMKNHSYQKKIVIYASLMRIPLIFRRNLALFALGTILMTSILSASISFMSGINSQELYLGRVENVVILAQPDATTPVTGSVPLSFSEVLESFPGVVAVSPETIGIAVSSIAKESITYRGITAAFFKIQRTNLILSAKYGGDIGIVDESQLESNDFFTLFSSGMIRGAIIGKKLVTDGIIDLDRNDLLATSNSGKSVTLSGTITDVRFDLTIVGIFETGTKLDEEILVSLPLAQSLSGHSLERVTLHRIKVDPTVMTAERMKKIISTPYSVNLYLNIINQDVVDYSSLFLTLYIRTIDGALVESIQIDPRQLPLLPLSLYIGIYELELRINGQYSHFITIAIGNQSQVFAHSTTEDITFNWNVEIPLQNYSFVVNWNGNPLSNASVELQSLTGDSALTAKTDENGKALLNNVPWGWYRLRVRYETPSLNSTVRYWDLIQLNASSPSEVIINGSGKVRVHLKDASSNSKPLDWNQYEVVARLSADLLLAESRRGFVITRQQLFSTQLLEFNVTANFNENGTAILELDPGIYDILLKKKNGTMMFDRVQHVLIGDNGFNDIEEVEYLFGKVSVNLTVYSLNVSENLEGHVFDISVYKQLENDSLLLENVLTQKLSPNGSLITLEVNASRSLPTVIHLVDLNTSLSNKIGILAIKNTSLEVPLAAEYQIKVRLNSVLDSLDEGSLLESNFNIRPNETEISIVNLNESIQDPPALTIFDNQTLLISVKDLWTSLNVTIITHFLINGSTLLLPESFIFRPYLAYVYEKNKGLPMNVTHGGVMFELTFFDAFSRLKVDTAVIQASFQMQMTPNVPMLITTTYPIHQGTVICYVPSLGRVNFTLSTPDGVVLSSFSLENHYSRFVKETLLLDLPMPTIEMTDLDGLPVSNAYYQIYERKGEGLTTKILLQQGYSTSDGKITLNFILNASASYLLLVRVGSTRRELTILLDNYQPTVKFKISIHYRLLELKNPYKFISTSNIFIGDVDSYLNEVFEGSILVLRLTVYVIVGILGILGGFSLLSLVSYPLAQHRRHFNIVRVIGGVDTMVALSTTFQLAGLAAIMTLIGILLGNISMFLVAKLSPTNIAGLVIEPNFDILSQLIFFLVITITVTVASFSYTLHYLRHLTLRGEIKEEI